MESAQITAIGHHGAARHPLACLPSIAVGTHEEDLRTRRNDLLDRVTQDAEAFTLKELTLDLCRDPGLPVA